MEHPIQQAVKSGDGDDVLDLLNDSVPQAKQVVRNITPLHHTGTPGKPLSNEKAIHRLMCYRSAAGDTPTEIAEATGYSVNHVRQVLMEERSRTLIAEIMATEFGDDVAQLLKGGSVEAVMTIRQLSATAQSETVKLNAAKDILDRTMGKPTQVIRDERPGAKRNLSPEEEAEAIEKELKELEDQ